MKRLALFWRIGPSIDWIVFFRASMLTWNVFANNRTHSAKTWPKKGKKVQRNWSEQKNFFLFLYRRGPLMHFPLFRQSLKCRGGGLSQPYTTRFCNERDSKIISLVFFSTTFRSSLFPTIHIDIVVAQEGPYQVLLRRNNRFLFGIHQPWYDFLIFLLNKRLYVFCVDRSHNSGHR